MKRWWALTALPVALIVAAPAHADVATDYASIHADAVCETLNDYPSFAGVAGVAEAIVGQGLSWSDAGRVIALSVINVCPQHTELLREFAATYGPKGQQI